MKTTLCNLYSQCNRYHCQKSWSSIVQYVRNKMKGLYLNPFITHLHKPAMKFRWERLSSGPLPKVQVEWRKKMNEFRNKVDRKEKTLLDKALNAAIMYTSVSIDIYVCNKPYSLLKGGSSFGTSKSNMTECNDGKITVKESAAKHVHINCPVRRHKGKHKN